MKLLQDVCMYGTENKELNFNQCYSAVIVAVFHDPFISCPLESEQPVVSVVVNSDRRLKITGRGKK